MDARRSDRGNTLTWPNDTDIAPEYLHEHVR
jgi:hypothetical protein